MVTSRFLFIPIPLYLAYRAVFHYIYRYTCQIFTAVDDLDHLGPREDGKEKLKGTALVCGGRKAQTGPLDGMWLKTSDGKETTVPATLIVSCTGISLSSMKWLNGLGVETGVNFGIEKESYDHNVVYTYCEVVIPDILLPKLEKILAAAWSSGSRYGESDIWTFPT
ncbi:hypothetical protein M422DRAFT_275765 [Sphaerobolus stellatus SS14]|uniref:Uncharacterized protein n=1 Tax=Sphaerobolus stellatus (strain SS14) TaxID=990650 RepID=A0A0C9U3E2_SPHS4|nr:hypothetical protein M422DRAFT_275765 [Sphaerobolus stellatus SS14]